MNINTLLSTVTILLMGVAIFITIAKSTSKEKTRLKTSINKIMDALMPFMYLGIVIIFLKGDEPATRREVIEFVFLSNLFFIWFFGKKLVNILQK